MRECVPGQNASFCTGSSSPSLLLTLCSGQAHPLDAGAILWAILVSPGAGFSLFCFQRSIFYFTRISSLPGFKVARPCPSSLLQPSVLHHCSIIVPQMGKARHRDGKWLLESQGRRWYWIWDQEPHFWLASAQPLACGPRTVLLPTQKASQGPKALNWEYHRQREQ